LSRIVAPVRQPGISALCDKMCRIFRWLGKPSPPTKNLVGRYIECRANEIQFQAPTSLNGQVVPLACPLCNDIRGMLPPDVKAACVSLGKLVDMIARESDAVDRAQLPYDMLKIKVQYHGFEFLQLFDIQLGLLDPHAGRTISVRPIMTSRINIGLLSNRLRYCDDDHFQSCRRVKRNLVPGFKAIDCSTHRIETLDFYRVDYTALSYVLGSTTTVCDEGSGFPATVEDSIAVIVGRPSIMTRGQ
jgi:hypothetical protein